MFHVNIRWGSNMADKTKPKKVQGRDKEQTSSTLTGRLEYEIELLQRHVGMLKIIQQNEPIGIIKLSNLSKFPQHKVRYSLRILEQENLIRPSPDGAVTTEKCKKFMPKLFNILSDMEKHIKDIKKSLKK